MDKGDLILTIIEGIVWIYDFFTSPLYYLLSIYRGKKIQGARIYSSQIRKLPGEVVYESPISDLPYKYSWMDPESLCTLNDAWKEARNTYNEKDCLGTRRVLSEEEEVQEDGKKFKKMVLGDYDWISYTEADRRIEIISRGLVASGIKFGDKLSIYADTCQDWLLTALAAFRCGFPLTTLYVNLGEDAIVYGLNHTGAKYVVTSTELLPKFRRILPQTPSIKTVIYLPKPLHPADTDDFKEDVEIVSLKEILRRGQEEKSKEVLKSPGVQDIAVVMFTSGSTGNPKGVLLTHGNLISALSAIVLSLDIIKSESAEDSYLAYLPLAHVMEMLSELAVLVMGLRAGYSHPNRLTDKSSMIKKGTSGDAPKLRPTIMTSVPLVLERIHKGIRSTLSKKSPIARKIFEFCYDYRLEALRRGETTPIMNFLVFRHIRKLVGGRLRLLISGGAPLASETHDYIRVCLNTQVIQGYGLTETTACATLMDPFDVSTKRVGRVSPGCQIKLVDWEEGNYKVTDKPNPRGEVVIGGPSVSDGYYNMPEKTTEDFFEAHGRRWFKTGDIGSFDEDGCLRIIDRKKDLVKLQLGEYVSLGKVESILKGSEIVENICVYGDSNQTYVVALVVPTREGIALMSSELGKENSSFEELCGDQSVVSEVLKRLSVYGRQNKLAKFEIPAEITLCKDIWQPDSGLVTAAFKLKRKSLQDFYQSDLDRMYGSSTRGL